MNVRQRLGTSSNLVHSRWVGGTSGLVQWSYHILWYMDNRMFTLQREVVFNSKPTVVSTSWLQELLIMAVDGSVDNQSVVSCRHFRETWNMHTQRSYLKPEFCSPLACTNALLSARPQGWAQSLLYLYRHTHRIGPGVRTVLHDARRDGS
jgi:hypothetical protein